MTILTVKDVAAFLRVSERHVFELCQPRTQSGDVRKHPLPCLKMGRSVRFDKEAVETWVCQQTVDAFVKSATKKSE